MDLKGSQTEKKLLLAYTGESNNRNMYSLLDLIKKGCIFQRDQAVIWKCRLCGYVKADTSPPSSCPICECSRAFFEARVQEV